MARGAGKVRGPGKSGARECQRRSAPLTDAVARRAGEASGPILRVREGWSWQLERTKISPRPTGTSARKTFPDAPSPRSVRLGRGPWDRALCREAGGCRQTLWCAASPHPGGRPGARSKGGRDPREAARTGAPPVGEAPARSGRCSGGRSARTSPPARLTGRPGRPSADADRRPSLAGRRRSRGRGCPRRCRRCPGDTTRCRRRSSTGTLRQR